MKTRRRIALILVALALLMSSSLAWAAGLTGAIYTTNSLGAVNINFFAAKELVYLNGGPAGGGSGLPAGEYFVKVTAPDGAVLGEPQTAGDPPTPLTQVTVDSSGRFAELYQLVELVVSPTTGESGFDNSFNGVYKVWVSRDPKFAENVSKTDVFKVGEGEATAASLKVFKFYDLDADGTYDSGEPILPNWLVHIQDTVDWWRYTGTETEPLTMILDFDTYTVTEADPIETRWVATTPKSTVVVLSESSPYGEAWFGNVYLGSGGGHTLGFWSNKNGEAAIAKMPGGTTGTLTYCLRSSRMARSYRHCLSKVCRV